MDGTQRSWYKDGQLHSLLEFKNGKVDGSVITYWENGRLKRNDVFKKDKFNSGTCYDMNGSQIDHFDYACIAEYPGRFRELYKYLKENIKYPQGSKKRSIFDKAVIQFTIDKDGNIIDAFVKKSLSPELDAEALRAVQKMPKWKPSMIDGEPVSSVYLLPVMFY